MADHVNELRQAETNPVSPDRRTFLQKGVTIAGGAIVASAAMDLLLSPAPAYGEPRPDIARPTCVAGVSETSAVTCDDGKTVVLWDLSDLAHPKRQKFQKDHNKKMAYVSVSAMSKRVFAASFDGDVTVRNLDRPGDNPIQTFTKHYSAGTPEDKRPEIWVVVPSENGDRALSGANNGDILFWTVPGGTVKRKFHDANERVAALAFLPPSGANTRFLSGHEDGKMVLWEFNEGSPTVAPTSRELRHGRPNFPVNTIAVNRGGTVAVSAGFDMIPRIWDLAQGTRIDPPQVHEDVIWRVAISPNGKKFVTASQDGTVRLFDIRDGTEFPGGHVDIQWGGMGVDFLSDTRIVYTTEDSNKDHVKTWDIPPNWPA